MNHHSSISKRVEQIVPSATLALSAMVKQMIATGKDVVNCTAGEPDFVVAEHIRTAAIAAINANDSYYSPVAGIEALREAVVAKMARDTGVKVNTQNVIVTNGGKESLFLLLQTVLEPGDEVIVPGPYWVSYAEQIRLAGGKPVILDTDAAFHFTASDVAAVVTAKTRMLLINSPSNPAGAVVSPEELERIAALAVVKDILVLSDEVYEHFLYDGRTQASIAAFSGMQERTFVVNSVSKTYCMTGWRVGYTVGPTDVIEAMVRLKGHLSSNVANVAQRAAIAALDGPQEHVETMRAAFEERRDLLVAGVNDIPGCTLQAPEGAFYGFIDCSDLIVAKGLNGSIELCEQLLKESLVGVIPGKAFGDSYDNFVRFSFAVSTKDIQKAVQRMTAFAQ